MSSHLHPASFIAKALTLLRTPLAAGVLLFVIFLTFYHATGMVLRDSGAHQRDDVFFRCDTSRALKDITGNRTESHVYTAAHPCFVLFTNPFGNSLMNQLKKWHGIKRAEAGPLAVIWVSSVAGAGIVVLACFFFHGMGAPLVRSVLYASLLGCSSTQMFFSSVPETYIFSALGLMAVAWLAARPKPVGALSWQVACCYAFANLTSSIMQVGIWTLARFWKQGPLSRVLLWTTRSMVITIVALMLLSLLQKWIYPHTFIFFLPASIKEQTVWLEFENLQQAVSNARILLQHLFISNILGPEPVQQIFRDKPMASIEAGSWSMFQPALMMFSLWALILLAAMSSMFSRKIYSPPFIAALCCLAFSFCFFFIFGNDRMLYSATWTLYTVMVVGLGLEGLLQSRSKLALPFTGLLAIFVLLQAHHNWQFLHKIEALVK
jgi:hypothetical protein